MAFFLRAMRVSSPEFLDDEIEHIFNVFLTLKYPKGLLIRLRKKARQIKQQGRKRQSERKRTITIPNFAQAEVISRQLSLGDMQVCIVSGQKIGDMVRHQKRPQNQNSVVYEIPCTGCQKSYIGETGRGLNTRVAEHKRDLRHHRTSNALVVHVDECGNLPGWDRADTLKQGLDKTNRRAIESAYILVTQTVNSRGDF